MDNSEVHKVTVKSAVIRKTPTRYISRTQGKSIILHVYVYALPRLGIQTIPRNNKLKQSTTLQMKLSPCIYQYIVNTDTFNSLKLCSMTWQYCSVPPRISNAIMAMLIFE